MRGGGARWRDEFESWGWIAAVALVPVLLTVVDGIRSGWWPIGDEALTAHSAWDVFHGHPPVMGPRTTTAFESGIETHHPGPVLYYLLAVPSALAGGQPWGLVIGSALITSALVVTGVAAARRAGGLLAAACTGVAFLGVLWAFGPDAAARPFNPYPPAIATLTWLVLTWALVAEHLRYVPHYVVVVSLMLQSHIGYLPFVAGPTLALVLLGLVRWWHRRRTVWPLRGWRPRDQGRYRWHARVAILLGVLVWLPPLVELFTYSPNNLSQVLRYVGAERGTPIPFADALRYVVGMLAPVPGGMTQAGSLTGEAPAHMVRHPRSVAAVAIGALVLVLVALLAIGRARLVDRLPAAARPWSSTTSEVAAAVTALAGVLALLGTVSSLPLSSTESTWNYLQTWPVIFFVWSVVLTVGIRRASRALDGRRWTQGQIALTTGSAALVGACLTAILASAPARWHEGDGVRSALPAVEERLAVVREHHGGRLHVTFDGDNLGASYYIAPSIAYALREDYDIHLPAVWSGAEDTDFRKSVTTPEDSVWISIRAGRQVQGVDGVDPRSEVATYLVDRDGATYTIFLRGVDAEDHEVETARPGR